MWESSESIPPVEMMIASITGGPPGERASAIAVDQRRRWKIGIEVSAEHYLHRCPDLAVDPQSRLKIVMGEFEARGSSSQLLPEFVQRFPDLEETLQKAVP